MIYTERKKMMIKLMAFTPDPVGICALAASQCYCSEPKISTVKACIKSGHESVIEHASFTFQITGVSRALLAQLTRHRIGWSYSVRSQRYVEQGPSEYIIPESVGSGPETSKIYNDAMNAAHNAYKALLDAGIKREDARMLLGQGYTTDLIVTANARALRHFFNLRLDKRAQGEIRDLAVGMFKLVCEAAPELFEDLQSKL
jgi:thymidylate synthase (FAD)